MFNIRFLVLVLVIAIGAVFAYYYQSQPEVETTYIDPDVLTREYDSIIINEGGTTVNLQRDSQGYWYSDGDFAFLVDAAHIFKLLESIDKIFIVRKLSYDNPSDYDSLVSDVGIRREDQDMLPQSLMITLNTINKESTTYLFGIDSPSTKGTFFSYGHIKDLFLVSSRPVVPKQWYKKSLLKFDADLIQKITVKQNSTTTYERADATGDDWKINGNIDESDNRSIEVSRLLSLVNPLYIDTFKKSKAPKPEVTISFLTKDQQIINLYLSPDNKKKPIFSEGFYLLTMDLEDITSTNLKKLEPYLLNKVFAISQRSFEGLELEKLE